MSAPQPTFGRRVITAKPSATPGRKSVPGPAAQAGRWPSKAEDKPATVPRSLGAGILTGTAVGVLELALHFSGGDSPSRSGPFSLELGAATLPFMILSAIWAGGRAGFTAAFLVRGVLRRLGRTSYTEYAIAGALIWLAVTTFGQTIGLTEQQPWAADLLIGAFAGGLYRLLAGAVPVF